MKKILKWIVIGFVALVVIGAIVGTDEEPENNSANNSQDQIQQQETEANTEESEAPQEEPEEPVEKIHYEAELSNGYFIAGVDFPEGTYDIEAIEGGGNVISTNAYSGGINAIMGTADMGQDMYEQKYSNIELPNGTRLSIDSVTVKIVSDDASGEPLNSREEVPSEKITLSNGNHKAGRDFDPGVYNIVAVKGGGNVMSDNTMDGGINAIMGTSDMGQDMYEQKYYNIELPEGTTLKLDGVTVDLIPVE